MKPDKEKHVPAYQDAPTLCFNLCISDTTLDAWVRQGILPPARERGGKRLWKWSEVEHLMDDDGATVSPAKHAEGIRNATRKAAAHG